MELHVRRADLRLDLTMEEAAEIRDFLRNATQHLGHEATPTTVYEFTIMMDVIANGEMVSAQ